MATASISGLSSGLDTASIVSQLMQLEAVPQQRLQSRVNSEEKLLTSFQGLNTKLAALATRATSTGEGDAFDALRTTSSLPGVSVSASADALPSTFAVTVTGLAAGHGETYAQRAAASDVVVPVGTDGRRTVTLTRADGTTTSIDTGDGTTSSLAAALNDAAEQTGVRASLLQVAPGQHTLLVDSTTTGADSWFSLTTSEGDLLGGADASRTRVGQDAAIEVGGFTITSATNTFTDLMPGIDLTLDPATLTTADLGKSSQVAVTRDAATLLESVKALVDNLNAVIGEIDTKSTYNVATGTRGDFVGDSAVRSLRSQLSNAIYPGGTTSMASLGLQVDRTGKLVLDEAAFTQAYEADPSAVSAAFGSQDGGFAHRVQAVAAGASNSVDGTLTTTIKNRQQGIERLNDSVAAWDLRLELRESALSRQFTALEVALSNMNSQSSWLTSQLSSLSTS